jgi:hypothetical protein
MLRRIAEAVARPTSASCRSKPNDQLDLQSLHRVRERWVMRRTAEDLGARIERSEFTIGLERNGRLIYIYRLGYERNVPQSFIFAKNVRGMGVSAGRGTLLGSALGCGVADAGNGLLRGRHVRVAYPWETKSVSPETRLERELRAPRRRNTQLNGLWSGEQQFPYIGRDFCFTSARNNFSASS